ncbi:toll/interleukin-1 receptor domain-containing protein [Pontibacter rugosus]
MKKVFLSHATEDKPLVEHIYSRLKEKYPHVKSWLDKYEIVGGDSLIDKIAEGIDSSEKFIIFLSDTSIKKPWVNKELKKAITQEINRGSENFIIPVLINNIIKTPSFLEDKFYIDVSQYTEDELIKAIYNAIEEKQPNFKGETIENLSVQQVPSLHGLEVQFRATYWAEQIAFEIQLDKNFKKRVIKGFAQSPNTFSGSFVEEKENATYRICVASQKITPDNPFFLFFQFDEGVGKIVNFKLWKEGFKKPMGFITEVRG